MEQRIGAPAAVPVMRMAHLLAFAGFLKSIGVTFESAFQRARLPLWCESPDAYVPVYRVRLFLDDMGRREGEALGWEAGRWAQEHHLHQSVIQCLAAAPTLSRALGDFSALVSAECSHYRLGITEREEDVLVWFDDTFHTDTAGCHIELSYMLWIILAIIGHFTGTSWRPAQVGIKSRAVPECAKEMLSGTRILTGQKASYIRLPRAFLGLAPERQWARHGGGDAEALLTLTSRLSFAEILRLVLESYLSDGCPSAERAATLVGTSSRTLRRRLESEGWSYSKLVDQLRLDVAKRLLNDCNTKMIEISYALGFSDPSHFARSFRRMTGLSPSAYRRDRCGLTTSRHNLTQRTLDPEYGVGWIAAE